MASDVLDRQGQRITLGSRAYFPKGTKPGQVVAIDVYRTESVQVLTGWKNTETCHTAVFRWFRSSSLVLAVPAR